jgi:hypothetical protein
MTQRTAAALASAVFSNPAVVVVTFRSRSRPEDVS